MIPDRLTRRSLLQAGAAAGGGLMLSLSLPLTNGEAETADAGGFAPKAFIRIEGMHCHRCELAIQKTLQRIPGVHEVEVDFATGQASILFDPTTVAVQEAKDGSPQQSCHTSRCRGVASLSRRCRQAEKKRDAAGRSSF